MKVKEEWKRKERNKKNDFHEILESTQIKTAETQNHKFRYGQTGTRDKYTYTMN